MSATALEDSVARRAARLAAKGLNGLRHVLVTLQPAAAPTEAVAEVFFHNTNGLAALLAAGPAAWTFSGGRRVPAGPGPDETKVSAVLAGSATSLKLSLKPLGDYSAYSLEIHHPLIDPLFAGLLLKFRPGCFDSPCHCVDKPLPPPAPAPKIDYLAKDYDSFRHTLITAMMQRVPGWQVSSEADLDQVVIDLIAAAGDELSDYQDRVMNEAWLATCRKRVSLARHARLTGYHIHQGAQASTWVALLLDPALSGGGDGNMVKAFTLGTAELIVRTGGLTRQAEDEIFATRQIHLRPEFRARFHPWLNHLRVHTWEGTRTVLKAGTTSADLLPDKPAAGQPEAVALAAFLLGAPALPGGFPRPPHTLLLQEHLNPSTGLPAGAGWEKRQLVRLTQAQAMQDPMAGQWFVRVAWRTEDALRADYTLTAQPVGQPEVPDVSLFHGNLVTVHHGQPVRASLLPAGTDIETQRALDLAKGIMIDAYGHWHATPRGGLAVWPVAPLAYRPTTPSAPPVTTLRPLRYNAAGDDRHALDDAVAQATVTTGGVDEVWDEVISLVHSDDTQENGDHFAAETDELGRTVLRFGNGVNGRALASDAVISAICQQGGGVSGNVGAGSLQHFGPLPEVPLPPVPMPPQPMPVLSCWNPFDVTSGCSPEAPAKVLRAAPEAWQVEQARAVTLADYAARAQEVPGVARAVARYAWTGAWRTVRVAIDPAGRLDLPEVLRQRVARHLEAVHLLGEDVEIRAPRWIPVEINLAICLRPEMWAQDVHADLEREFSTGWTADGRPGFFHPDQWTFGQALHRSQIEGRVHRVAGVEHLTFLTMKRFNAPTPGSGTATAIEVGIDEIIQVLNDPDSRETGTIRFTLQGGRQP